MSESLRARMVQELAEQFGAEVAAGRGPAAVELALPADRLPAAAAAILARDGRLLTAYATADNGSIMVRYILDSGDGELELSIRTRLDRAAPELFSLAPHRPSAAGLEREMSANFGLRLRGHPDGRTLVGGGGSGDRSDHWRPIEVTGGGAADLADGPVRTGLRESALMHVTAVGESIVHVEPRLRYKHRAIEALVPDLTPERSTVVIERACGTCAVANATAFALAIEDLAETDPPERAVWLRTALLEIERIAAHGEAIAGISATLGWLPGASAARSAREELMASCEAAVGQRSLRGVVTPGGVRRDAVDPGLLASAVRSAAVKLGRAAHDVLEAPGVRPRLYGLAVVGRDAALDLDLTGPVARASGVRNDVRLERPYLAYDELTPWSPAQVSGDAIGRFRVWQDEIEQAATIAVEALENLPSGPLRTPLNPLEPGGQTLALVEAPGGRSLQVVHADGAGRIERWHMRAASHVNWPALPIAAMRHRTDEIELIERSFALCVSCVDR